MRALLLVVVLALNSSCATVKPVAPTVPDDPSKRVEQQPLPADPAALPLPTGLPKGDWTAALEDGKCVTDENGGPCPMLTGIVVSEERAWRDAQFRLAYKEIRIGYEVDRKVWGAQRALYEGRLNDANTALEKAQPNWFQRHAWELGIITGLVVGTGAAIGIVYGVVPAFKVQTP
jgi:hypothetical protein